MAKYSKNNFGMEMWANDDKINELSSRYNNYKLVLEYNFNQKNMLVGKSHNLSSLKGLLIITSY